MLCVDIITRLFHSQAILADDPSIHIVVVKSLGRTYKRIATRGGPMAAAQWLADAKGGYWLFTAGLQGLIRIFYIKYEEGMVRASL